jgi:two-component system, OmpR family, phosphate regulon sensor histidine kinase PhoR
MAQNNQMSSLCEQVLFNLKDGIILADNEGRLLLVNRSAGEIFNLEASNIVGMMVGEVFHHPDLLDLFKPQHIFPYRSEITLDEGRVYSAQASLIEAIGIAVVMQDITHLKELDRIKTDFVNTVSHDLRSPLTAIYGFVGLLDRVGPVNEQQVEFIHHIQSNVHQITSLIDDLLDLGRVEADYDLHMDPIDMQAIIGQVIENVQYQISEKKQEMSVSFSADSPLILGNTLHLQRMATNLIENAIKFSQPGGKISIKCGAEAGQFILKVADNGPGIPLDDQPHIFEKFFRGSNTSQDVPGTGLGLSIVKTIVDRHHGRIWLDSSTHGTTFTVIFPLK